MPDAATERRLQSLSKGNAVRVAKARLKREMRGGEISPVAALVHPAARRFRVEEFLRACPRIGTAKTHRILRDLRFTLDKRVENLTDRQRALLAREIA